MYTAKIVDKKIENGSLLVNVNYTNGVTNFNVIYPVRSEKDLDNLIRSKLEELEALITLEATLTLGVYTPTAKETPIKTEPTPLELATETLYKLKEKINLGVLKETDQEFIDAVTAYKTAEASK